MKLSIKMKVTLWFTFFMIVMASFLIGFMAVISSALTWEETRENLSGVMRENLTQVSIKNGTLSVTKEFNFYKNGVYSSIYNQDGALLTGQVPPSFDSEEPFQNGLLREVDSGGETHYVMDLWLQSDWEHGLWLRGVLTMPAGGMAFSISLIILPFLVILGAVGGYLLSWRAFRPINRIIKTVNEISETSDLSGRTGIPHGKDEIGRLAAAFDRMFERLERSFESEKQFIGDASHELRTPTAVILAQCDYAEKHAETEEDYQDALEVIGRQAGKMSRLIGQLLSITRLEQGTQSAVFEVADLSELVTVLCKEMELGKTETSDITLRSQIESGITCRMDVSLMSRLIQNLLENAFKYGTPGGYVEVRLFREDETIRMEFKDNGIGIGQEEREKIWQRFYQVDPSRSESGGLGLGLSMVRQIAELHGGTVGVESVLGVGSLFWVQIPEAGK